MTSAKQPESPPFFVFNKAAWDEKYPPSNPDNYPPGTYLQLSNKPSNVQLMLFPELEKEKARDAAELLKSSVRHAIQIDKEVLALKAERKAIWAHLEECGYQKEEIRAAKAVVRAKSDKILGLLQSAELGFGNASRVLHLIQILDLQDEEDDEEGGEPPAAPSRPRLTLVHSDTRPEPETNWGVNAGRPENAYPTILDAIRGGANKAEAIKACVGATGKTKLEVTGYWDELTKAGRIVKESGAWVVVETVSELPEEPELAGLDW